ncbi:ABC transporter ATP-binding protein [Ochrobactrum sp. AN78]|uniref:ABC transporter ATP-binding protein n=1 Tax=Ochrobactrum sp. AN78 TaxID=3039853 RepID=UPI002989AF77|nr:ABC transporter ATP-binding protein [Ochrobactrum sp. AN78]MDH7791625.1 energy-coupling factor transporter ATP-binding protein EcfA2 [Ochrobactrum sp. AN78]
MVSAEVLLLDEPTSALDLKYQVFVMQSAARLARLRGAIVVAVLHDVPPALRYADVIAVLKEGTLHAYGMPQVVVTPAMLANVYGTDARIESCSQWQNADHCRWYFIVHFHSTPAILRRCYHVKPDLPSVKLGNHIPSFSIRMGDDLRWETVLLLVDGHCLNSNADVFNKVNAVKTTKLIRLDDWHC